jgi:hypothetical protein
MFELMLLELPHQKRAELLLEASDKTLRLLEPPKLKSLCMHSTETVSYSK